MKEMVKDRLILLATAQQSMADITDKMDCWKKSRLILEKSAFDSINVSDKVLNLSKEGNKLVINLLECCKAVLQNPTPEEQRKTAMVLNEIHGVFQCIADLSASVNDISHIIEGEAAKHKGVEDDVKKSLTQIGESIDAAIACAELYLAEL
jgi:hypothetical protein